MEHKLIRKELRLICKDMDMNRHRERDRDSDRGRKWTCLGTGAGIGIRGYIIGEDGKMVHIDDTY